MLQFTETPVEGTHYVNDIDEILATGNTEFQEFLFFRSPVHGTCVVLDGDLQSTEADEGVYHESLVHPAMMLHGEPRNVLIMGGGEGATAREVLRHPTVENVVMVDIDREFVELCQEIIPDWGAEAFADPRLDLRLTDIHAYLADSDTRFDVVIGDLVDIQDWDSPAANLYGQALYRAVHEHMNDGAVIATQAGPIAPEAMENHQRIRNSLQPPFADVRSYGVVVPSFNELWGFALARRDQYESPDSLLDWVQRFEHYADKTGIALPNTGPEPLAAAFTLPNWAGL